MLFCNTLQNCFRLSSAEMRNCFAQQASAHPAALCVCVCGSRVQLQSERSVALAAGGRSVAQARPRRDSRRGASLAQSRRESCKSLKPQRLLALPNSRGVAREGHLFASDSLLFVRRASEFVSGLLRHMSALANRHCELPEASPLFSLLSSMLGAHKIGTLLKRKRKRNYTTRVAVCRLLGALELMICCLVLMHWGRTTRGGCAGPARCKCARPARETRVSSPVQFGSVRFG